MVYPSQRYEHFYYIRIDTSFLTFGEKTIGTIRASDVAERVVWVVEKRVIGHIYTESGGKEEESTEGDSDLHGYCGTEGSWLAEVSGIAELPDS